MNHGFEKGKEREELDVELMQMFSQRPKPTPMPSAGRIVVMPKHPLAALNPIVLVVLALAFGALIGLALQ